MGPEVSHGYRFAVSADARGCRSTGPVNNNKDEGSDQREGRRTKEKTRELKNSAEQSGEE